MAKLVKERQWKLLYTILNTPAATVGIHTKIRRFLWPAQGYENLVEECVEDWYDQQQRMYSLHTAQQVINELALALVLINTRTADLYSISNTLIDELMDMISVERREIIPVVLDLLNLINTQITGAPLPLMRAN